MRIYDLEEHMKLGKIPGTWLNSAKENEFKQNGKMIGLLHLSYGSFPILEIDKGNIKEFAVINDFGFYCIVEIRKYFNKTNKDFWVVYVIERNKNLESRDMMAAIFHYLVLDKGYDLISSTEMTTSGTKFWKSISERGQLDVKLYDAKLDKIYDLIEGQTTEDGFITVFPENDGVNRDYLNLDKQSKLRQQPIYRFFYLATKNQNLAESHVFYELLQKSPGRSWGILFGNSEDNYDKI